MQQSRPAACRPRTLHREISPVSGTFRPTGFSEGESGSRSTFSSSFSSTEAESSLVSVFGVPGPEDLSESLGRLQQCIETPIGQLLHLLPDQDILVIDRDASVNALLQHLTLRGLRSAVVCNNFDTSSTGRRFPPRIFRSRRIVRRSSQNPSRQIYRHFTHLLAPSTFASLTLSTSNSKSTAAGRRRAAADISTVSNADGCLNAAQRRQTMSAPASPPSLRRNTLRFSTESDSKEMSSTETILVGSPTPPTAATPHSSASAKSQRRRTVSSLVPRVIRRPGAANRTMTEGAVPASSSGRSTTTARRQTQLSHHFGSPPRSSSPTGGINQSQGAVASDTWDQRLGGRIVEVRVEPHRRGRISRTMSSRISRFLHGNKPHGSWGNASTASSRQSDTRSRLAAQRKLEENLQSGSTRGARKLPDPEQSEIEEAYSFVDIRDVSYYVTRMYRLCKNKTLDEILERVREQKISKIANASKRAPFIRRSVDDSLASIATSFKHCVHVPIFRGEVLVRVLSPADFLSILVHWQVLPVIARSRTLSPRNIAKTDVQTLLQSASLLKGLTLMERHGYSAVPIVSEQNPDEVIEVITVKDLKFLCLAQDRMCGRNVLNAPALNFVQMARDPLVMRSELERIVASMLESDGQNGGDDEQFAGGGGISLPPFDEPLKSEWSFASNSIPAEAVVRIFLDSHIHRIILLDDRTFGMTGMLTLTDFMVKLAECLELFCTRERAWTV